MLLFERLIEQPQAALVILERTPRWVWGLLCGLVVVGALQLRARSVAPVRVLLLPLGLTLFSLGGVVGDWMSSRWLLPTVVLWLLAFGALVLACGHQPPPSGVRYESAARRIWLPGSAMPLLLIFAIFLLKYAVGVELALRPALREQLGFALGVAAVSGALSGLLAGRSTRLWRFARQRAADARVVPSSGAAA